MNTNITAANINEYGRFDELKATVDKAKAKAYFEALEGQEAHAESEFEKYRIVQDRLFESDFDRLLKQLEHKIES